MHRSWEGNAALGLRRGASVSIAAGQWTPRWHPRGMSQKGGKHAYRGRLEKDRSARDSRRSIASTK
jgi:hypothetical protein